MAPALESIGRNALDDTHRRRWASAALAGILLAGGLDAVVAGFRAEQALGLVAVTP